jgi:predicted transcriptional regulator of viral defense system
MYYIGEYAPHIRKLLQVLLSAMDTSTFLQTHRVFNLDEAVQALAPSGGRKATLERLKYAAARNKLKKLARGVYASVPPGVDAAKFQPDRFLVAAALRPDAVFSHHSALELLGAAHSEWRLCTAYSGRRSQPFDLDGLELRFLSHPQSLVRHQAVDLGIRSVHRLDRELRVTGPERTLIDGFRRPDLVGGLAEFVESASGFSVLELPLLFTLLEAFGQKGLWAAVGWFLDTYRTTFYVSDDDLALIGKQVPKEPLYLAKDQRGGVLVRRWNLIVPEELEAGREPDESQR